MFTVLVIYRVYEKDSHPLLDDGGWRNKGKVIKVKDLSELNDIYEDIVKVDILNKE